METMGRRRLTEEERERSHQRKLAYKRWWYRNKMTNEMKQRKAEQARLRYATDEEFRERMKRHSRERTARLRNSAD